MRNIYARYARALLEVYRHSNPGNTQKQVELVFEREGERIPVAYFPPKMVPVIQLLDNEANRARFMK